MKDEKWKTDWEDAEGPPPQGRVVLLFFGFFFVISDFLFAFAGVQGSVRRPYVTRLFVVVVVVVVVVFFKFLFVTFWFRFEGRDGRRRTPLIEPLSSLNFRLE